jgi:hypothetical protein
MSNKNPIARHLNKVDRQKAMLEAGKCPECEIKLESPYHTYCKWLLTPEAKRVMHSRKSL